MALLDLPPWTPAITDVALYILARTRLKNGTLAGTFTSATTPTDDQVTEIIEQQVRLLTPRLGDVADALADSATALLALKAAISVERSYFMEQIGTDLSPYKELCEDFKLALMAWEQAAEGDVPNGARTASLPCGTLYPGYATGTY